MQSNNNLCHVHSSWGWVCSQPVCIVHIILGICAYLLSCTFHFHVRSVVTETFHVRECQCSLCTKTCDQCMAKLKPVCKKITSAKQQLQCDKLCEKSVKHAAACPGAVKKPRTHHMILRQRTTPLWTISLPESFVTIHDGLQSVYVHGLQVWVPPTVLLPQIQVRCRNSQRPVLETQCLSTDREIVSMYQASSERPCGCEKRGSEHTQTTSLWRSSHDGSSNMVVRQAAANNHLEWHWPGARMWPEMNEIRTETVRNYFCTWLYWCCYVMGPARPTCTSVAETQLYIDVYLCDENYQ